MFEKRVSRATHAERERREEDEPGLTGIPVPYLHHKVAIAGHDGISVEDEASHFAASVLVVEVV